MRPAVLTAACLTLAALAGCASPGASAPPTSAAEVASPTAAASARSTASAPSAAAESIDNRAEASVEVEGGPDFPTEGFGSLWLLAPDSDEPALVRVDPTTNAIVATVPLPDRLCQGFVITDDAVWACTADGAVRIDPATNAIVGSVAFDAGQAVGRLAFGGGSVWALGSDAVAPNTLVRIDPVAESASVIPLGHDAGTLAYGFDAVWVTAPADGVLLRVDPASGEVREHTIGLESPWSVAVGPDSLWLTLFGLDGSEPAADDPTVTRVNPEDGSVLAEIATGAASGTYGGLWAGDDGVWVRAPDMFLVRIDPMTNEVGDSVSGPGSAGDVTSAFGSMWATAVERNAVYRFDP